MARGAQVMRSHRRGRAAGAHARRRIVRSPLSSAALAGVIAAALLAAGPAYATDFVVGTDAQLRSAVTVAIQDLVIANATARGGGLGGFGGSGGGGGAGLGGAIFVANLANVSASN